MKDIQIIDNETVFNYRVSGAVIKDNKILLNRLKSDDFWTFVGGKVAIGENSEKAIIREYYEETGANIVVERLAACVENFFVFNSKEWHEILFLYLIKDENEELDMFAGEREIKDNSDGIYKWFDLAELDKIKIKPECSQQIIYSLNYQSVQHIINES
ncbi:MAG: NUDIX domain-containing protein [Lachnospiraceae bacterium]|nr:NUDIX domain-containing protein [Lachnospiraceae bacterium]